MSDGLKLLGSIIDTGSVHTLREISRDWFIDEELDLYDLLQTHYRRYGQIPAIATVEDELGIEIPEAEEVTDYYIHRVNDRKLYGIVRDKFNSLKECLRDFNMEAAKDVIAELHASTRIARSTNDIRNIREAMQDVMTEYEYAHQNPGVSGVPTSWMSFDYPTGGCQPGDLITWVARPSMGKCMAPETPVLRYDGEVVRIDSLKPGDCLMGPDSKPRVVLSTTTGAEEMYEVVPSRGETWRCNKSHMLALECGKNVDRKHRKGEKYIYSVEAFLSLPSRVQKAMRLWRTGVEFPSVTTPIDPYFVGLWLGDGTVGYARVSTVDPEISEYLQGFAASEGLSLVQYEKREGACPQYGISGVRGSPNFVMEYIRNKCYDKGGKRIPSVFKVNDRKTRLAVLAGLIDSDGYNFGTGYEIVSEYYPLSEDILYLARSLGYGATRSVKKVNGVEYYRMRIYGAGLEDIPCLLPRKRIVRGRCHNTVNSSFTLRSVGEGQYFGITLPGDHLYLLGDFTVTHNTYVLLKQAHVAWQFGYSVLIVTMEMTIEQITRRLAAMHAGINPNFIRKGMLSTYAKRRLQGCISQLAMADKLRLFSGGLRKTTGDVELLIQEYRPDIVFIDGVYLMQPNVKKAMQKIEKVSEVFDNLKQMTIAHNVPVVVTTQFNRQAGKKGKDGSLENIAFTDAISTHSSLVLSLAEAKGSAAEASKKRMIRFLKGREGESGEFEINFKFAPVDFSEIPRTVEETDPDGNPITVPAANTAGGPNLDYMA